MTYCENCKVDHEEEMRKLLPDAAILSQVFSALKGNDALEVPEALTMFTGAFVEDTMRDYMDLCQSQGLPPAVAVSNYAQLLGITGFLAGLALRHEFPHWMDTFSIDQDKVSEYITEHWDDQKRYEEKQAETSDPLVMVRKVLDDLGLNPDEVKVVSIDSNEKEDPGPGLYL